MSELGRLLKSLRGKESLRKAAERAGISHTYLSIIEKGVDLRSGSPVSPTPETLKSLAKAYDYPYEKLMIVAGYIKPEPGSHTAEETIELINEKARSLGFSPNDPEFLKMLSNAFDLLQFARDQNQK